WRTQAPSSRPASNAAAPSANGIEVLTSPVSRNGGWISIPGSTSSGLSPCPSTSSTGDTSNGGEKKTSAARNVESTTATLATACGAPHGMRGTVMRTNAAMNSDIIHVQNSSDPA